MMKGILALAISSIEIQRVESSVLEARCSRLRFTTDVCGV